VTHIKVPSIVWQKWTDPFLDGDITHSTPEDFIQQPEYIDDINDEDEDDSNISDLEPDPNQKKEMKVVLTPLGIIPYDETTSIGHAFNLWIGHTNFDLSTKVSNIIEKTNGVETLDVFTRYRFRIGIGQLFNSADVMSSITHDVYEYLDANG
jgi:hypothetical protein